MFIKKSYNTENTAWETADYPLFLGQDSGLYDSIHVKHPKLFELYKLQKSIDWDEGEIDLAQSRTDLEVCDKSTYDLMVKTLAYQWSLDSCACQAIAPLLAPFVSNSEYWAMIMKQSEIEVLHALTYSEIVRQCVKNPKDVFKEAMHNENILYRSKAVVEVFDELKEYSAKYTLGLVEDDLELRKVLVKALVALYALEGIEFMASFAVTFGLAEQQLFLGVAQLVQKIMSDEQLHVMMDRETVDIVMQDPKWVEAYNEVKPEIKTLLDEVVKQELDWNNYLFSEGRRVVGLTKDLLNEWVLFRSEPIYKHLGIEYDFASVNESPLPWMANWMDIDSQSNANQEQSNNNYRLNVTVDDIGDDILDF